jgi:hypothetical protein
MSTVALVVHELYCLTEHAGQYDIQYSILYLSGSAIDSTGTVFTLPPCYIGAYRTRVAGHSVYTCMMYTLPKLMAT